MSLLACEKTFLLVDYYSHCILVTDVVRRVTDEEEQKKANPKCSPHVLGFAIDVKPLGEDSEKSPATWKSKNYDRERTQQMVDYILEIDPCAKLLFNDPKIKGVSPYKGHDDHIHITWSVNRIKNMTVISTYKGRKTYRDSVMKITEALGQCTYVIR